LREHFAPQYSPEEFPLASTSTFLAKENMGLANYLPLGKSDAFALYLNCYFEIHTRNVLLIAAAIA
jgi:hypothetical protein